MLKAFSIKVKTAVMERGGGDEDRCVHKERLRELGRREHVGQSIVGRGKNEGKEKKEQKRKGKENNRMRVCYHGRGAQGRETRGGGEA